MSSVAHTPIGYQTAKSCPESFKTAFSVMATGWVFTPINSDVPCMTASHKEPTATREEMEERKRKVEEWAASQGMTLDDVMNRMSRCKGSVRRNAPPKR